MVWLPTHTPHPLLWLPFAEMTSISLLLNFKIYNTTSPTYLHKHQPSHEKLREARLPTRLSSLWNLNFQQSQEEFSLYSRVCFRCLSDRRRGVFLPVITRPLWFAIRGGRSHSFLNAWRCNSPGEKNADSNVELPPSPLFFLLEWSSNVFRMPFLAPPSWRGCTKLMSKFFFFAGRFIW